MVDEEAKCVPWYIARQSRKEAFVKASDARNTHDRANCNTRMCVQICLDALLDDLLRHPHEHRDGRADKTAQKNVQIRALVFGIDALELFASVLERNELHCARRKREHELRNDTLQKYRHRHGRRSSLAHLRLQPRAHHVHGMQRSLRQTSRQRAREQSLVKAELDFVPSHFSLSHLRKRGRHRLFRPKLTLSKTSTKPSLGAAPLWLCVFVCSPIGAPQAARFMCTTLVRRL
mmetsp:Transcript_1339/g.3673  ORF Transcript_1339/g.3673 Transcript_1339/m.3673 type:complete len:233 (-) Transcript_1339:481-1179(-)